MSIQSTVEEARARLADFVMPQVDASMLPELTRAGAAASIDHTLLKPDADREAVHQLCREAAENGFAAVCVNPVWVRHCREWLSSPPMKPNAVAVCTVVGFPLGATLSQVKAFEAKSAIEAGAQEVDMVLNIGALRDGDYAAVARDIATVVDAVKARGVLVKVIFENCLLSDEQKAIAAALCVDVGADFVKTSTGFSTGGATLHDVALMRHMVGNKAGVKAAGGVRTGEDLRKMVAVGATRIGTSAGVAILDSLGENTRSLPVAHMLGPKDRPNGVSNGEDY